MDIEILSRKQIEKLLYHGGIDTDTAIISFCDEERKPVNLTLTKASSFKVIADDLDMDELLQNGGYDNFFSTAKAAARFVFTAVSMGKKTSASANTGRAEVQAAPPRYSNILRALVLRSFQIRGFIRVRQSTTSCIKRCVLSGHREMMNCACGVLSPIKSR